MLYECPKCHARFQSSHHGLVRCPSCDAEVRVEAPVRRGTAWDRETGRAWVEAFIADITSSITDPMAFFERVAQGGGWVRPWIFALVIASIVFFISAAYQAGFQSLALGTNLAGALKGPMESLAAISFLPFSMGAFLLLGIVFVPVGTTLALVIQAAVYHLCLLVLGAARREFLQTFRVVCYSMGPQLFGIVPLIGGIIAWVWQIVLVVFGIKIVHQTSFGRSAVAVFLPVLLCCGAMILVVALSAGWIFAAIMSQLPS